MKKKNAMKYILIVAIGWLSVTVATAQTMRGEAVIVHQVGQVRARVETGTAHGRSRKEVSLSDGMSIGERDSIRTGKDGHGCLLLSPGAMLCVAPESELMFNELRHSSDGLPRSSEEVERRIQMTLARGRIHLRTANEPGVRNVRVMFPGGDVHMSMGAVSIAQSSENEWIVTGEEGRITVTPTAGAAIVLRPGEAGRLVTENGSTRFERDDSLMESPLRIFESCEVFFDDLKTFIDEPQQFDRSGLNALIGAENRVNYVGSQPGVLDVSPAFVEVPRMEPVDVASVGTPPPVGGKWDRSRIWSWYENLGAIKGVNYTPSYAVNSVETWMEDAFDPKVIDEELGWAQDIGYTAVRVQLQYVVWQADPDGFKDRMVTFLDIADKHDLVVVPVLFDDKNFAGHDPNYGKQPEPIPGAHNAQWVPSPGTGAVRDRSQWPLLEDYVKDLVGSHRSDDRIAYWDLYNRTGDDGQWEESMPLMDQAFNWAREADPEQPLAVAAWSRMGSAMTLRKLERSDFISFQSFDNPEQVAAMIHLLKQYNRPIICSDWLLRQQGNTFENILPLFAENGIGWFNRGLVRGETQEWIQQPAFKSENDPDIWQHDVVDQDGHPYSEKEVQLIKAFDYKDAR